MNNRDMPAGYDPSLDTEFEPMQELDMQFSAPPSLNESGEGPSALDSELFGDASDDYDPTQAQPKGSGRSIFEAALKAEQERNKKGSSIPAYAKDLLKERRLHEQDEDEDEDVDEEDGEYADTYADEFTGDDSSGDGSFDFGDDESTAEFGDEDDEDLDDEEDDYDIDDEDLAQTDEWKSEQDVDEEMARLLGDDSPYVQGASGNRGGGARSGAYAFDKGTSPTYNNAVNNKSSVDDSLVSAEKFESGSFIEHFDDGFVFVSSSGSTMALVKPEEEDDNVGFDVTDTYLRGLLLFKPEGAEDEDDEIVMELSGEELDSLANALQNFKSTGGTSFMEHVSVMDRARRKAQTAKHKRK
ncbi:MAG: hypothetical protein LC687_04730 [Actinobacteria bacterium]|nr:hypothetical protein [Actinomycetota bacterium]MCA1807139.1 hypothetical protein [Actinomycetota bacterium]